MFTAIQYTEHFVLLLIHLPIRVNTSSCSWLQLTENNTSERACVILFILRIFIRYNLFLCVQISVLSIFNQLPFLITFIDPHWFKAATNSQMSVLATVTACKYFKSN